MAGFLIDLLIDAEKAPGICSRFKFSAMFVFLSRICLPVGCREFSDSSILGKIDRIYHIFRFISGLGEDCYRLITYEDEVVYRITDFRWEAEDNGFRGWLVHCAVEVARLQLRLADNPKQ